MKLKVTTYFYVSYINNKKLMKKTVILILLLYGCGSVPRLPTQSLLYGTWKLDRIKCFRWSLNCNKANKEYTIEFSKTGLLSIYFKDKHYVKKFELVGTSVFVEKMELFKIRKLTDDLLMTCEYHLSERCDVFKRIHYKKINLQ